jgi:hypothetical protein
MTIIEASPKLRKILERGDDNLRLVLPPDGVNDPSMPTITHAWNEGQPTGPCMRVNWAGDRPAEEPQCEKGAAGELTAAAATPECPLVPVERNDQDRLKPILWSDLHRLPKREVLIEGLLDCGALSLMFGPSGCGKTFFALDLAVHIASGMPWRGRTVHQGAVVYVAAEGGYGMLDRLTAFSCKYGTDPKDVPLYVIPEPIDLCHSDGDVDLLLGHLDNLPKDQTLRLIHIDTASRALAGGNENSPDHMGVLIKRCDKLRAKTGAHVMLLHHTGKDTSHGARGHSSLRAAVDTEIELTWDKEGQSGFATVTKQRDSRTEGSFAFKLAEVDVDMRANGDPITSCVLVPIEQGRHASQGPHLTSAAQTALSALTKAIEEAGHSAPASKDIPPDAKVVPEKRWREYAYKEGISKKAGRAQQTAFKRALELLIPDRVGRCGDLVWVKTNQQGGEHTNTP